MHYQYYRPPVPVSRFKALETTELGGRLASFAAFLCTPAQRVLAAEHAAAAREAGLGLGGGGGVPDPYVALNAGVVFYGRVGGFPWFCSARHACWGPAWWCDASHVRCPTAKRHRVGRHP